MAQRVTYQDRLHQSTEIPVGFSAAVVDDEAILARTSRGGSSALLYFSPGDYQHAIRDLNPEQVCEVVAKRLAEWAPDALTKGTQRIYDLQRRCLTLAALASVESAAPPRIRQHLASILDLLTSITQEGRYDILRLTTVVDRLTDTEARVRAESINAKHAFLAEGHPSEVDEASSQAEFHRTNYLALKRCLDPAGDVAEPDVGLNRVVFVPRSDELLGQLRAEREPFACWRDGVVYRCSVDDVGEGASAGRAPILYLNSGQFLEDLRDLTQAQREREFALRLQDAQRGALSAWREHLHTLWLDLHLRRRSLMARACREDGSSKTARLLSAQVSEEQDRLRASLAAHPTWDRAGSRGPAAHRLIQSEQDTVHDAQFFAALSGSESAPQLIEKYEKIAGSKAVALRELVGAEGTVA
jgi:hypothetical protein